ncbi:uncharacterized protein DS421_13g412290 [Arachis hypogaea]|nr:uncharacterized protein DS421_13g412290 [Arachis hypogaea]
MARNIVRYVVAIISIIGEIVCFAFAECDDTICDRFATSHELSLCIGRCRRAFSDRDDHKFTCYEQALFLL